MILEFFAFIWESLLRLPDKMKESNCSISSGLTFTDKTTFSQAIKIIKKYDTKNKIPRNVIKVLQMSKKKKISKPPIKSLIKNIIIANNEKCLLAMENRAKKMNYDVSLIHNINYDVKLTTKKIIKKLQSSKKSCLIFGGESTVNVIGTGCGGRNQELVLRIANELKNKKNQFIITSIGTDGIDGNTKYAGAIFSNDIKPFHSELYLENNDSFNFFKKHGGLIYTGPTHSNLNDIGVIIRHSH